MSDTVTFFLDLLKLATRMADNIMPDLLLQLDRGTLEYLMAASQEANNSLQVFAKLCGVISRRNLSSCSASPVLEQGHLGEIVSVLDAQQSQPLPTSSGDDSKSIITNCSVSRTHNDDLWKGLLNEAGTWYSTHIKEQIIPHVYYCGICNKQAKAKHIWEAHLGGKNHVKLFADVCAAKFVCGTCGLNVCGENELIEAITASDEHRAFDALICDNRHVSSGHSTTAGCSSKDAQKKPGSKASTSFKGSDETVHSADRATSSADSRCYMNGVCASRADASHETPQRFDSTNAGKYADKSASAASGSRSARAIKKNRTNPHKSGSTVGRPEPGRPGPPSDQNFWFPSPEVRKHRDSLVQILLTDFYSKTDKVFDNACSFLSKIEGSVPEKALIEIVTTAVIMASLKDGKLNMRHFVKLIQLVQKYVDNKEELELISLFAVKNFTVNSALELSVLTETFRIMYDDGVISVEAFKKWKDDTSIEPKESEGRLIAIKALEPFYVFLAEFDEDDEEEE